MTPIVKLAHLSMKLNIELLVITCIRWSRPYLSKSVHKDKFPHSWRLETCRFAECRCRMPICAVAPCCAPSYRRTLILQRALQRAAVCSLRGRAGCIPTVQRAGVQAPHIPCVQHDWVNELQSIYHHRDLQHTHCSTAEHGTGLGRDTEHRENCQQHTTTTAVYRFTYIFVHSTVKNNEGISPMHYLTIISCG